MKRLKKFLIEFKKYLSHESAETQQMLEIYVKYTQKKATKKDIAFANKQLRDIFKSLGFGVVAVLPFAVITLPVLFWLSNKTGVNILPDWFDKKKKEVS